MRLCCSVLDGMVNMHSQIYKKYSVGVGVGMGTFCLPREGAICKRFFFYWNLINDPLLIGV